MRRGGQNSGTIFHGWWIVLVAAIGLSMGYGPIVTFTFGVFFKPLSQEFGWNLALLLSALGSSLAFVRSLSELGSCRRWNRPGPLFECHLPLV